jgi:hypothetical protein
VHAAIVAEGRLRTIVYENLGAFRMDMVDAMAGVGVHTGLSEAQLLRSRWLTRRTAGDLCGWVVCRVGAVEDGALVLSRMLALVIQKPDAVRLAVEFAEAAGERSGLVARVAIKEERFESLNGYPPGFDYYAPQQSFGILPDEIDVVGDADGDPIDVGGIFGRHR